MSVDTHSAHAVCLYEKAIKTEHTEAPNNPVFVMEKGAEVVHTHPARVMTLQMEYQALLAYGEYMVSCQHRISLVFRRKRSVIPE